MTTTSRQTEFGTFTFLDQHAVIAEAYEGVEIDGMKVQQAIALIEQELAGDYGIILFRKADYSVMPLQVYQYFSTLPRLRALAIVNDRQRDFLPGDMEKRIYKGKIEKFTSIESAHEWMKTLFDT